MRHEPLPSEEFEGEDDELHLVDPEASKEPLIGAKAIISTFFNAFFTSALIVYVIQSEFRFDLLTLLLAICGSVAFGINAVIAVRIFHQIKEQNMKYDRPEQFRNYANQLSAHEPVIHEKVASDYRNKFRFWPRGNRPSYV
ncbi:hypothetical protein FO519_009265 [Halicephalobus sp. NKZ332]|nr:hypothetical protein FO519_009265 [Halicephalobus sp. NKZ332]